MEDLIEQEVGFRDAAAGLLEPLERGLHSHRLLQPSRDVVVSHVCGLDKEGSELAARRNDSSSSRDNTTQEEARPQDCGRSAMMIAAALVFKSSPGSTRE